MPHRSLEEASANARRERPGNAFLGLLRAVCLVAIAAGAVGSVGWMLRAGQRAPRFLQVLFTIWVLSPFVGLLWAQVVSKRWPVLPRATLHGVTLAVTLGSLAVYGELVRLQPTGSPNAFLYVLVPPTSWVFMAVALAIAALVSRRRSRQDARS